MDIFPHASKVTVTIDTIAAVDPDDHRATGKSGRHYEYDKLLLAPGVVTEYYAIKGLADYSYGIKSVDEALRLKDHLHEELTRGHEPDQHYVVVGGGPTGVELAGELVSYLTQIRRNHHRASASFKVHLIEAAPRILPILPEDVSKRVKKRLEDLGIEVHPGVAVAGETKDQLLLPEGRSIKTHGVVWTAGVTNAPLLTQNPAIFELGRGKRVVVGADLRAAKDVYVMCDSAGTKRSGWAQTALYDGKYVATNIIRARDGQKPALYRPRRPLCAIPVGPGWCAVADGASRVYGRSGWRKRRRIDLLLMLRLLPKRMAVKAWLAGNLRDETCGICRGKSFARASA